MEKSQNKLLAKNAKIERARKRKYEEVERIRRNASASVKKQIASQERKRLIDNKVDQLIKLISNISRNLDISDKSLNSKIDTEVIYDDLVITQDSLETEQNHIKHWGDSNEVEWSFWTQQMTSFENYYEFWVKNSDWMELIMKNVLMKKKRSRSYSYIDKSRIFKEINFSENWDKIENNSANAEGDRNIKDSTKLNSTKEITQEELKNKNISVGLSHDMLMKLDQENMNKFNLADHNNFTISSGFHPVPQIVASSSINVKPRNNKNKQSKLMPSK